MHKQQTIPRPLLIGHGSRHPATADAGQRFAQQVSRLLGQDVYLGWLDYCAPPISDLLAAMKAQEIGALAIQPLMLTPASHVSDDIPNALQSYSGQVHIAPPLGGPELLHTLLYDYAAAALNDFASAPTIFLIARDSHGPAFKESATALAALLEQSLTCPVAVGYVGATDQGWADCLDALPPGPVLALPTLLFAGKLWDQIAARLSDRSAQTAIMPPLTEDPRLAQTVAQRIRDLQASAARDC